MVILAIGMIVTGPIIHMIIILMGMIVLDKIFLNDDIDGGDPCDGSNYPRDDSGESELSTCHGDHNHSRALRQGAEG